MKRFILAICAVLTTLPALAKDWSSLAGQNSSIAELQKVDVSDAKSWKELWTRHAGESAVLPTVDFERERVVGVFLGNRPSLGYSVDLLVTTGEPLTVTYRENAPSKIGFAGSQKSSPFALIKVARFTGEASIRPEQDSSLTARNAASSGKASIGRAQIKAAGFLTAMNDSVNDPALASLSAYTRSTFDSAAAETGALSIHANLATQQKPKCTPGVDCPEQEPQPKPKKPKCTPGVDCQDEPKPKPKPRCTPGVDCPGDNDRGGNGRTPLPPNYRSRPSDPTRRRPPVEVPYDDSRVDVAGWWHPYSDFLGYPTISYGSWRQETGSASLTRGGSETGMTQATRYTAPLKSSSYRNTFKLYWRYVGIDCDPNDTSRCVDWDVQFRWFFNGTEYGESRFLTAEIEFASDEPLLPWEKERFTISFDGGKVWVNAEQAGFNYSVQGPIVDWGMRTATIKMIPTSKRLNAPESDKVNMYLAKVGGSLKLVVEDARNAFYAGEALEISVQVRWDDGKWYSRDPLVLDRTKNGPIRLTVRTDTGRQTIDVPTRGGGGYYIEDWSFRRAESKISSNSWIYRGKGNTVKY